MKKIAKFFSCFLLLLCSFLAFPACGSQSNNDDTGYKPLPKMEEYFKVDSNSQMTMYEIENYEGDYLKAYKSSDYSKNGFNHCAIKAIRQVKIKKIEAMCFYNPKDTSYYAPLPDTWTTDIYVTNYTLVKGEAWNKKLTMTPDSNPNIPEIMEIGDEINFVMWIHPDYNENVNFNIADLKIVIQNEDFPNGALLQ